MSLDVLSIAVAHRSYVALHILSYIVTYDHHKAFIVLFSFSPYLKSGECLTTCINSDQCYRFLAEDKHNE